MSRLTDPVDYCWMKCYEGDESVLQENCKWYPCFEKKMWDKLNHYEDLEEVGRLIELPCKVGDTVWVVPFDGDYFDGSLSIKCGDEVFEDVFEVADLEYMGSIVFLTKAEAEAKLAELKGGE